MKDKNYCTHRLCQDAQECIIPDDKCLGCGNVNYLSSWSPWCAQCQIDREQRSLFRNGWAA